MAGDHGLSNLSHAGGLHHAHVADRGMKRGDSYLFKVVDDLPMAPAPDFVVSFVRC